MLSAKSNPRFKAVQGRKKTALIRWFAKAFQRAVLLAVGIKNYRRPATGALRYLSVATRYR